MYVIEVMYQNQKEEKLRWAYKVHDSIKLAKGDKVVVSILEDYLFKVATVVRITDESTLKEGIKYRWVAQKLDLSTYEKCLK